MVLNDWPLKVAGFENAFANRKTNIKFNIYTSSNY